MNKTNFNRICRLHKEGISEEVCISMIIELAKTKNKAAFFIAAFMQSEVFPKWQAHNFSPKTDFSPR
jgi:hypothetical protein